MTSLTISDEYLEIEPNNKQWLHIDEFKILELILQVLKYHESQRFYQSYFS